MQMRKKSLSIFMAATTGALFTSVVAAQQASAADLILGSHTYLANTTALTLTGPSVNVHGTNVGGVAVFKFHTIALPTGGSITASGSRPFELLATGSIVVGGVISSNGTSASDGVPAANAGGAGGGAGGGNANHAGHGPGGGGHANSTANGGGGGGFGGKGAAGGVDGSGVAGVGGAANGDLNVRLQGGSGGGGASNVGGGGGGGAIGLFGSSVTIQAGAVVVADGGNGDSGSAGASGGGSAGGIIVHGSVVHLAGELLADGGGGGGGGCCGDGGGGAGGRIAIQYKSFSSRAELVTQVFGGDSGSVDLGHGSLSPSVTGANGLVSYAQIDASKLSISANRSITKGHTTTTATKLTDAGTGAAVAGRTVTLWRKPKSGGSWAKIATRTTSSSGGAAVTVKPGASALYQWRFGGTLIHLAANSPVQTITVH
jgi:hypothetical protein